MKERFIYKTIKEAKVDYVLKGWSIELDQEDAVVVSKQKNITHLTCNLNFSYWILGNSLDRYFFDQK